MGICRFSSCFCSVADIGIDYGNEDLRKVQICCWGPSKWTSALPHSQPDSDVLGSKILCLKVHLHEIFYSCFFSSKAPTWSPDSNPKFISNIKSNSPRYSNHLSLCVDSVNAELIFCFKLYKNC